MSKTKIIGIILSAVAVIITAVVQVIRAIGLFGNSARAAA